MDDYKKDFRKYISKKEFTNRFEQIRFAVKLSLDIVLKKHELQFFFNKETQERMLYVVIFYYLLAWYENDNESQQTLLSFVKMPYNDEKLKQNEKYMSFNERVRKLRYYEKWYRDNIALQNWQALKEDIVYKRASYKKVKQQNKQKMIKEMKYDFVALRFMELLEAGKLDIYRLLFYRKEPLKIITTGDDDALLLAYREYCKIPKEVLNEKSARKFVASYFQFVTFENTYRFIHAAHLVQYMLEKNLSPEKRLPDILQMHYYRLISEETKKVTDTQFIGGYKELDKYLTEPASSIELAKIERMRIIMETTLNVVFDIFPFSRLGTWAEQDYENAMQYFLSENNVLYEFANYDFEKCINSNIPFSENIRKLYNNPWFMEQGWFAIGHEILRNKNN